MSNKEKTEARMRWWNGDFSCRAYLAYKTFLEGRESLAGRLRLLPECVGRVEKWGSWAEACDPGPAEQIGRKDQRERPEHDMVHRNTRPTEEGGIQITALPNVCWQGALQHPLSLCAHKIPAETLRLSIQVTILHYSVKDHMFTILCASVSNNRKEIQVNICIVVILIWSVSIVGVKRNLHWPLFYFTA